MEFVQDINVNKRHMVCPLEGEIISISRKLAEPESKMTLIAFLASGPSGSLYYTEDLENMASVSRPKYWGGHHTRGHAFLCRSRYKSALGARLDLSKSRTM
jgi:hypothetical protein